VNQPVNLQMIMVFTPVCMQGFVTFQFKVKVKLSLCFFLTEHHAMKP